MGDPLAGRVPPFFRRWTLFVQRANEGVGGDGDADWGPRIILRLLSPINYINTYILTLITLIHIPVG